MRKIAAGAFVSLDGVMQALGAPEEDRERTLLSYILMIKNSKTAEQRNMSPERDDFRIVMFFMFIYPHLEDSDYFF